MNSFRLRRLTAALALASQLLFSSFPAAAAGSSDVQVAFSPGGGAEALVLRTIGSARQSIRLLGYSFTAAPVARALVEAKQRGVDVAVAVDYKNNLEEDRTGKARTALNALVNASIPVRVVRGITVHSKFIVVDGLTVETGSYNYSTKAARYEIENVVIVYGRPDVARPFVEEWQSVYQRGDDYRPGY